jgi:hypothetical protein
MPLDRVNDIHSVVRGVLFDNLWSEAGLCFSIFQVEDASAHLRGNLFQQDHPFLMCEVVIDIVRKAGPGIHSPNRVWGGLELTYYAKERLDLLASHRLVEEAGDWFAQKTLGGVRFRECIPTSEGSLRGFHAAAATVAFEYETKPTEGII